MTAHWLTVVFIFSGKGYLYAGFHARKRHLKSDTFRLVSYFLCVFGLLAFPFYVYAVSVDFSRVILFNYLLKSIRRVLLIRAHF